MIFFLGFYIVGGWTCAMDVAPDFAGTIMGISSCLNFLVRYNYAIKVTGCISVCVCSELQGRSCQFVNKTYREKNNQYTIILSYIGLLLLHRQGGMGHCAVYYCTGLQRFFLHIFSFVSLKTPGLMIKLLMGCTTFSLDGVFFYHNWGLDTFVLNPWSSETGCL